MPCYNALKETSDERLVPNIFKYATSELSQDAMIAWLMACAKAGEDDAALREVGQSFIRFLLETPCNGVERAVLDGDGKLRPYDGDGVVSGVEVWKQYKSIDVYCCATIDDQPVTFVIEDKIDTLAHGDQLERYKKTARQDPKAHYIKLIYLKTGMPFDGELDDVAKKEYCPVHVHDLKCFLNGEPANVASSDLLQQYRTHISEFADVQIKAERDLNMDWGPIQRRFAEALKDKTGRTNDSWAPHDGEPDVIWQSRNRGGSHWTQYRFFGWHLFWRMDTGKNLRMMVERNRRPNMDVYQYQKAFLRACDGGVVKPADFNFRRGNEMTVGAIQYPAGERKIGQDINTFLQSIAQVHERFLQELAPILADNSAS